MKLNNHLSRTGKWWCTLNGQTWHHRDEKCYSFPIFTLSSFENIHFGFESCCDMNDWNLMQRVAWNFRENIEHWSYLSSVVWIDVTHFEPCIWENIVEPHEIFSTLSKFKCGGCVSRFIGTTVSLSNGQMMWWDWNFLDYESMYKWAIVVALIVVSSSNIYS